ncbi:uncharacterized protein V1516DRAFT_668643 [Lipomyces oligophaga]|uniref:uncharacterized protein n=1 Tax=Lipomyces oligophaga TaxID=45792 RepID=UPI0034CE5410
MRRMAGECHLEELPQEILLAIYSDLEESGTRNDLQNLAYTCNRLYSIGQQFLLADISLTWELLDALYLQLNYSLRNVSSYIRSLSIIVPSSWGEWHRLEVLQCILDSCVNLSKLSIVLAGSSKWIHYLRPIRTVRELTLISNQASADPALFDTVDLHAFQAVEILHLNYFRLQCEYPIEERATPLLLKVKDLEVVNCEWNYPFSLSLFKNLRNLSVQYSIKCEAFTFSERLKNLAVNPPTTIETFVLHLNLFSQVRQKTWYPILQNCIYLRFLSLKGFRYPAAEFFASIPPKLEEIELHMTPRNYIALAQSGGIDTGMWGLIGSNGLGTGGYGVQEDRNFRNGSEHGRMLNKYGDTKVRVVMHSWPEGDNPI